MCHARIHRTIYNWSNYVRTKTYKYNRYNRRIISVCTREVHFLDCSGSPPAGGTNVKSTFGRFGPGFFSDMCVTPDGETQLVMVTDLFGYHGGVRTHSAATGHLKWTGEGKRKHMAESMEASGIAADGCAHLFVCDVKNKQIHLFRVRDGRYLGALMRKEGHGLGEPRMVRWCEATSSLVVGHKKNGAHVISFIKIQ